MNTFSDSYDKESVSSLSLKSSNQTEWMHPQISEGEPHDNALDY